MHFEMKRATVLLLALLLVPATQAEAKFSSARICGPSDCQKVDIADERAFVAIVQTAFARGPGFTSKPPEAAPWYRVTLCGFRCDSPDTFTLRVLPTAGYEYAWRGWGMRRRGWAKLDEAAVDVYRRVTADLEPFPVSRLVALGAEVPESSGEGGIPAWVWIAITAGAATLALLSLRSLRASQHSPSLR